MDTLGMRNRWAYGLKMRHTMAALCLACALLAGCIKYGPIPEEEFSFPTLPGEPPEGVFIVCEGNFMYGNASLSFYLPSTGELQNEVFARANGMKLGDVAQSMTLHDGLGYVVVNNSGIIFGIDPATFRIKKVIRGIGSPRYIHFQSGKAYVTSLYEPRIAIVDPQTTAITGYIETPGHTSTEQMVAFEEMMFVSCWSYDNTLIAIDTRSDKVVKELKVRSQPRQMTLDRNGKLWVLTDGGLGNAAAPDAPALYRIDAATFTIEEEFLFRIGDNPKALCSDGAGETIYYLNDSVWKMNVSDSELPEQPFIRSANTIYFALGVDPVTSEIYLGDAIDYQQQGVVYRFSAEGEELDRMRVGIIPSSFCFK